MVSTIGEYTALLHIETPNPQQNFLEENEKSELHQ